MIIGISGKKQVGKDTAARIIQKNFPNTKILHFADILKDMCIKYFGLKEEDVYTTEGKQRYNSFWGMTNRQILQKIGTDCFRKNFDQNVWVKLMELKLENQFGCVVIPDVRFNNEAQMILQKFGIVINITRDSKENDTHVSENGLSQKYITYSIENNGSFQELEDKLIQVLNDYQKNRVQKIFEKGYVCNSKEWMKLCEKYKEELTKIKNPANYTFLQEDFHCIAIDFPFQDENVTFQIEPYSHEMNVYNVECVENDLKNYKDRSLSQQINIVIENYLKRKENK